MDLVNIVFLGNNVKVTFDSAGKDTEASQHAVIGALQPGAGLILPKDGEKFKELYKWCKANCDFKNDLKKQEVSFLFRSI